MEHTSVYKVIKAFVKKYDIQKNKRILIAFSGGKDSLALLKGFKELDYDCVALYVNHRLRSDKELEKEINLNKENCEKLNTKLIIHSLEKDEVYKTNKIRKRGIEDSARYLRYKALLDTKEKYNCDYIATAHSLSDLRETILLRLKRKESFLSLKAINVIKDNIIIRPLLCLESADIISSLESFTFSYDTSNKSLSYTRNLIRSKIEDNTLNWENRDKHLASLLKQSENLNEKVNKELRHLLTCIYDNSIKIKELENSLIFTRIKFYQEIIKTFNLNTSITTSNLLYIDSLISKNNKVETKYYSFRSCNGSLFWNKSLDDKINYFCTIVNRPNNLLYGNMYLNVKKYEGEITQDIYLEKKDEVLIARSYINKDKIKLNNNFVLVSKLLKDQKVDKDNRSKCIVICNRKEIVCVIASHVNGSNRVSDDYKINDFEKEILVYKVVKEKKNG